MNEKQIIGCVRMKNCDLTAEKLIHMEHLGTDAVFLMDDDAAPMDEEKIIKLIKAVHAQSDLIVMVKRPYKRLEDVKKIIYAGNTRVVIDMAVNEENALMREAVERFGKDNVYAWSPMLDKTLANAVKANGVVGCVIQNAEAVEIAEKQGLTSIVLKNTQDVKELSEVLKLNGCCGVASEAVYEQDCDVMGIKYSLKNMGVSTNCFESAIDFSEFKLNSDGLIPVIVQEYKTGKILMLAYMNEESYNETIRSGRMTYWSRSRQELWKKGDTSGHYQYVKSMDIDCDKDTILAKVAQIGAACHTGNESCFFTNLVSKSYEDVNPMTIFEQVMETIMERKEHPKEGSYTTYLFEKGIDKILKKVGEEATEIVIAAKNPDSDELKYEICDFLYHMMVLMAERDVNWKEITKELASRH